MYYVLYETGNEDFFSHIAEKFCLAAMMLIKELYTTRRGNFVRPDHKRIDIEDTNKFFKKNKEISNLLKPLNCAIFAATVPCKIPDCKANYRAVIASNQKGIYSKIMADTIGDFEKDNFQENPNDLYNFQRIIQNHKTMNKQDVEKITTPDKRDSAGYMNSYVKGTNKIKKIFSNFVYVRAKTDSDYNDFMTQTRLPNVRPCDAF